MIKRLIVASTIAAGLALAPAAFADDMSKSGMAKDSKMDSKMDKKTDAMSNDKMSKTGGMMDKKDSMSKDSMSKDSMNKN